MRFPTKDQIIRANQRIVAESGEGHAVLHEGHIGQAIYNAQMVNRFDLGGLPEAAAAFLFHITGGHPFEQGNKRTGWTVAKDFLKANGFTIAASADEAEEMCRRIAREEGPDKEEIAAWIEEHLQKV